jgi:hypothetical protein
MHSDPDGQNVTGVSGRGAGAPHVGQRTADMIPDWLATSLVSPRSAVVVDVRAHVDYGRCGTLSVGARPNSLLDENLGLTRSPSAFVTFEIVSSQP